MTDIWQHHQNGRGHQFPLPCPPSRVNSLLYAVGTSFVSCTLYFFPYSLLSSYLLLSRWTIFYFFIVKVHFFLKLNFNVLFPYLIKCYHIMFIITVCWLRRERPSRLLFFHASFNSFHTHAFLLTFFVCFIILFHCYCSHAHVCRPVGSNVI